jgi:hypothetical protein
MYVESFILTVQPPEISGGSLIVGELQDGGFAIPGFPGELQFGGVLELGVDDDEPAGRYEVEILLEYARLQRSPQALLDSFPIDVPDTSQGWWGPRVIEVQPLQFDLTFWDEFEGFLVVKVNGEEIAERILRVIHHALPDGL